MYSQEGVLQLPSLEQPGCCRDVAVVDLPLATVEQLFPQTSGGTAGCSVVSTSTTGATRDGKPAMHMHMPLACGTWHVLLVFWTVACIGCIDDISLNAGPTRLVQPNMIVHQHSA